MRPLIKSYVIAATLSAIILFASYLVLTAYVSAIDGSFFDIINRFYWALIVVLVADGALIAGIGALIHKKQLLSKVFVDSSYKIFYHIGSSVFIVALIYLFLIIIY